MEKANYDKVYMSTLLNMKKIYFEHMEINSKKCMADLIKLAADWRSYKDNKDGIPEDIFKNKFASYVT